MCAQTGISSKTTPTTKPVATQPPCGVVLLAVGSELLDGRQREGNAARLAATLAERGVPVESIVMLPDRGPAIVAAIEQALAMHAGVIVSGGLGPTFDDLTRQAIARALGRAFRYDLSAIARIENRFCRMGRVMPDSNQRQALIPEGAQRLENPVGTAPGFICWQAGLPVACLPGVPAEFDAMVPGLLAALGLSVEPGPQCGERFTIRVVGASESAVGEILDRVSWSAAHERAICVHDLEHRIVVSCAHPDATLSDRVTETAQKVRERFPESVVLVETPHMKSLSLEEHLAARLTERGLRLAAAESVTAGSFMASIAVASSAAAGLVAGVVGSPGATLASLIGLGDTLPDHWVSGDGAIAMARAVRSKMGAHVGVGIVGHSAADAPSPERVGEVHCAVVTECRELRRFGHYLGDRARIQRLAARLAVGTVLSALDSAE